ncbi:MAG: polyribonucleotide nucleotidyltransferase [Candidatus Levybacteria bacterium]|nr:polyribonucleotide nucleotidyltransferase [Candidatus Levybacteria bacterium]
MKKISKSFDINGKTLILETGTLASLATSSVLARMGETVVLATVTMGRNDTTLDYFPLSVEYVEHLYAGGKIKGSRWVKREGRPSDDAVLTGRLIDRSIRPLFPKELKKDVQVIINVLSVDGVNDPDILSINAVSAAIAISKIPWNGPVAATRVGVISDTKELAVNPDSTIAIDLDFVLTASNNGNTVMVEAGASQVGEDVALKAVKLAKDTNATIVKFINDLVKEIGETKIELTKDEEKQKYVDLVEKSYKKNVVEVLEGELGENVSGDLMKIADIIVEAESKTAKEGATVDKKKIFEAVDYVFKKIIRENIVEKEKRFDGRKIDEIRDLSAQVSFIPRVHGSALFSRGQTQVLSIATLASSSFGQLIETLGGEETKRYMHHYTFPPFSVGETGRIGSPSRREIGHGALAERAIEAVLPTEEEFPYAIRVVSEVLSSNGSTSMASTCGSTLALMDAGVPIKAPVAGIAIGLMTLGDKYKILTDIIGMEDFAGDMDFKVAGTKDGITAIQLDVKVDALTDDMIAEVFDRAKKARLQILDVMLKALPENRSDVSVYAPKIKMIKIDPEKIGGVIGSGGKVIKNIIATTGAQVDIEDDGSVSISAVDEEAVKKAVEWVEGLTHDVEPGEVYEGTVKRMMNFGAFVEILPGKEGLVHVSEMSTDYVQDPADVVKLGQKVKVRVKEIDDMGRINLSMKFGEDADKPSKRPEGSGDGGDRGGDRGPRGGSGGGFRGGPPRGGAGGGGFRSGPRRDFGGGTGSRSSGPSRSFSGGRRTSSTSDKKPTYQGGKREEWRG